METLKLEDNPNADNFRLSKDLIHYFVDIFSAKLNAIEKEKYIDIQHKSIIGEEYCAFKLRTIRPIEDTLMVMRDEYLALLYDR